MLKHLVYLGITATIIGCGGSTVDDELTGVGQNNSSTSQTSNPSSNSTNGSTPSNNSNTQTPSSNSNSSTNQPTPIDNASMGNGGANVAPPTNNTPNEKPENNPVVVVEAPEVVVEVPEVVVEVPEIVVEVPEIVVEAPEVIDEPEVVPLPTQLVNVAMEGIAAPAMSRRLTKDEYLNSVADLLAFPTDHISTLIINDKSGDGFRNALDALQNSSNRTNAYEESAIYISENIDFNRLRQYTNCTQFSQFCMESFVKNLGNSLFRKPLNNDQVRAFSALFDSARNSGDNYEQGAKLILQAMLQSPHFIYKLEVNDNTQGQDLSPYTIASRLSFLLWQSAPDQQLLQKAQSGGFMSHNLNQTVDEMIRNEKFKRFLSGFVTEWLELYKLRDRNYGSDFGFQGQEEQMITALENEMLGFFERVILDDEEPFMSVYTDQRTNISPELREIYGQNQSGNIDWSNNRNRIGFLTQAGLLASHGKEDATLIKRGLFVLKNLQCRPVPRLPDDVQAQITADFMKIEKTLSQRDRVDQHNSEQRCKTCHSQFDGFGFAFEAFGTHGEFLTHDKHMNPVMLDGIARVDARDIPFSDVTEFAEAMETSEWAKRCVVEQNLAFALGRTLSADDKKMVDGLYNNFQVNNQSLKSLIKEIALSDPFVKQEATN